MTASFRFPIRGVFFGLFAASANAFFILGGVASSRRPAAAAALGALPDEPFLENDLVAIRGKEKEGQAPRLCVVRPGGTVAPLCRHGDGVETDLFLDPRCVEEEESWQTATEEDVVGTYGEGWYGQRPVPSLGGGPGYGAEAQETWSVDEDVLEQILDEDGVSLPLLDVGIAHGEKARGGSF